MIFGPSLFSQLREKYRLEKRRAAGDETDPPCARWHAGTYFSGSSVTFLGTFKRHSFTGHLVVGPFDGAWRLIYGRNESALRSSQNEDPHRRLLALDPLRAAIEGFSPAVSRVTVGPRGVSFETYGPAALGDIERDIALARGALVAIAELRDPPLLDAVKAGDLAAVNEMLAAGHDPFEAGSADRDYPGAYRRWESPLMVALVEGKAGIVRALLAKHPLPPPEMWQALRVAIAARNEASLEALLASGDLGFTKDDALRHAIATKWFEGVRVLLAAGAFPASGAGAPAEIRLLLEQARSQRTRAEGAGAIAWENERTRPLHRRWRGSRDAWKKAAAELGLSEHGALTGTVDGHDVIVETVRRRLSRATRISAGGVPLWLALRRESPLEKLGLTTERFTVKEWHKKNDIVIRHTEFDDKIDARGPQAELLAVLSKEVRRKILWLVDKLGGEVVNGRVAIERLGRVSDADRLIDLVRAAVDLAKSIAQRVERGTLACLHENACKDGEYERVAMLETLAGHHRGTKETEEACRLALSARYDWLRVTGAGHLGDEGTSCFRSIVADPTQRTAIRRVSMDHVSQRQGTDAEDVILPCLSDSDAQVVLFAAEMLGARSGTARSVEPLLKLAGVTTALGRAATAAIEKIQARLQNAAPGQLAIAPAQEGELSMPSAEGALSEAKKK